MRLLVRISSVHSVALCVVLAAWAILQADAGTTGAGPIRRSEYLTAGDARLYLLTRGADRSAPVLLWLHGGPGGAERPLFRYFNSDLEDHFVVVYWDQRGAGRSFDSEADPRRLTIARHLADLDAVVTHLRTSLGHDQVILAGHSWGAALGLLYAEAHPEKVSAIVAVNPLVSTRRGQQAQYDFVLAEASRRGDDGALERLREIGAPPFETADEVLAMEKLVRRYGGVFHNEPSQLWVMIRGMLLGLVTPWEIQRIIRANRVSLSAMHEELLRLDLADSAPRVEVPVLFFLGRHDRQANARLAAAYFAELDAPAKRLVWFENSAHNVPFEEPEEFHTAIRRELAAAGIPLRAGANGPQ